MFAPTLRRYLLHQHLVPAVLFEVENLARPSVRARLFLLLEGHRDNGAVVPASHCAFRGAHGVNTQPNLEGCNTAIIGQLNGGPDEDFTDKPSFRSTWLLVLMPRNVAAEQMLRA